MKMSAERRAIDKIFKRRDRYEIPDWQREEVWDAAKKQRLVDSILRGWKLPKFYFVRTAPDEYEVVDGQQRLSAIFDFFSNELPLAPDTASEFGGPLYRQLTQKVADTFDDFEVEYDVIEDASDEELKDFFQRLQAGLPLTSSEKLNAIHSKLRDYCRTVAEHPFFTDTIAVANTRYSHFDIAAKVATLEIEGLDTGLRFEDIRSVFESQRTFSATSAIARRIEAALDVLQSAFKDNGTALRTRTVVQSLITLTCKLVTTRRTAGFEKHIRQFFEVFIEELAHQVEMGSAATDSDYLLFQHSVNANVKGGAKTRHEILLRKLFRISPSLADLFDPSIIAESGLTGRIAALGDSIVRLIEQANAAYSAKNGEDCFKATSRTVQALMRIKKPARDLDQYKVLIDDLYFLFRESVGSRLGSNCPASFSDINSLRTDLRHDTDHGNAGKVRAKRRSIAAAFASYAGAATPETLDPMKFPLVHANLLTAVERDLRALTTQTP